MDSGSSLLRFSFSKSAKYFLLDHILVVSTHATIRITVKQYSKRKKLLVEAILVIKLLIICSLCFFQSNPCQHPIVILRDVNEDDMRCLLNFMYHGEVSLRSVLRPNGCSSRVALAAWSAWLASRGCVLLQKRTCSLEFVFFVVIMSLTEFPPGPLGVQVQSDLSYLLYYVCRTVGPGWLSYLFYDLYRSRLTSLTCCITYAGPGWPF